MAKKKASEDMFNELHNLVTTEFLARIRLLLCMFFLWIF